MIAWGITYVVHSSLLIAAVWLLCRFVRSTPAREMLWKLALIAPLVTATIQLTVPMRDVIPQAAPARITLPAAAAPVDAPPLQTVDSQPASAPFPAPVDWRAVALGFWLAGAALLLLRLLAGRVLFARALRDRVDLLREHDRLSRLRAAMSCRPLIRLTESSAVGSPIATSGWEIVVPRDTFARLSNEQKETILAHEIAHLLRRDPLWLLGAELIKALLFIQPLNWLAQKKMKECAEFLSDDLAVMHTRNPRALAETLAELATSLGPTPRAVAAMAEGGSNLMARVARVLGGAHRERPLRLASRVTIATTAVIALAAFAPGMTPQFAGDMQPGTATIHFDDGVLSRTFEGPEGSTKVQLTAKDLDISEDATSFHFTSRSGFLRLSHTAAHGPARAIEMTPGPNLALVIRYRVGGQEQPWCDDARRVVLSAFRAEKAYIRTSASASTDAIRVTPRQRTPNPDRKLKTWDGNVELTGSRDHVPTALHVRASNVRYDDTNGEVFFTEGAFLEVQETIGDETRTFRRDSHDLVWSGPFGQTEVSSWLEKILVEQAKMPRKVARAMGRE
jgi:beta-lactamase regulating signal transducer with metallopeptidase domain